MALISHSYLFPHLEILRVRYDQLRLSTSKIRIKMRLPHLKKLDLRGCLVKIDDPGAQFKERFVSEKRFTCDSDTFKKIKQKALAKNYKRVKWQDSPDSSDAENKHR
jgi:hypothetical protein